MGKGGFYTPLDAPIGVLKAIEVLNAKGRESERVIEEAEAEAITSNDNTPPNPVTLLAGTKHEHFMRIAWVNPLSSDLYYLKVTKSTDGYDDNTETFYISAPTTHVDDLDTIATSDYTYTVVAVDNNGNESTPVSVEISKETLPAPDEIFNETWVGDALELSWDHVDGFGVSGYRVQIFNSGVVRRTEDVTGTKFDYTFAKNSADGLFYSVAVRVYTIDALGAVSVSYIEKTITHVLPAAVTNVVVAASDLGFLVTWTLSTDPGITGYDVFLGGVAVEQMNTTGEYLHKTLLAAGDYQFAVVARNRLGQLSSLNTQPYTVDGPAIPASISASVIDNSVMLKWSAPAIIELPIVSYQIRKGNVFATAEIIGEKQGTFTIINESISGNFKYWVVAVDSAGNIGVPISVTTSVDEPADYVLNVLWEKDFTGGDSNNVHVREDGTAIAPINTTQTWEEKFIGTGTALNPQFETTQDLIDDGNTYICEPVPATAYYEEELDYGADLGSSSVVSNIDMAEYGIGADYATTLGYKLLITDTYTTIEDDQLFAINFRYALAEFNFVSDGNSFFLLNQHTLRLDSKLKSDAGTAVITNAATGVQVYFNKAFVDVTSIVPGAAGDGSARVYPQIVFDFVDNQNPEFFWAHKFDDLGNKITGDVPYVVKGY